MSRCFHKTLILRICLVAFLLLNLGNGIARADEAKPVSPPVTYEDSEKGFRIYHLPAGTAINILLQTPIDTSYNHVDDLIDAEITNTLYLGTDTLLDRNTRFKGRVSMLKPPIQGRNAILRIGFDLMILENGEKIPIEAHVKTATPNHVWGGELTQGTKPRRVTHRVYYLGEYNQTVMAGPREMGKAVTFPPGEPWTIILEKPVTVVLPRES